MRLEFLTNKVHFSPLENWEISMSHSDISHHRQSILCFLPPKKLSEFSEKQEKDIVRVIEILAAPHHSLGLYKGDIGEDALESVFWLSSYQGGKTQMLKHYGLESAQAFYN